MSREVDEVLAVWRELERVRESLPVGSTARTLVSREIRDETALSLADARSRGVARCLRPHPTDTGGPHDTLRRAKLKLELTSPET
jgi:hypothetical protein